MIDTLVEKLKLDLDITNDNDNDKLKDMILAAEAFIYSTWSIGLFVRENNVLLKNYLGDYSGGVAEDPIDPLKNADPMLVRAILVIARKFNKDSAKGTDLYDSYSSGTGQNAKPSDDLPSQVKQYLESKRPYYL